MSQESLFPMPQQGWTSDDYWTPSWIFDALDIEFDIDVACPPGGPTHTPCKSFYTQETDGLTSPWNGIIFMNPPYSQASKWVHKFLDHRNGIALTVQGKSKWADRLWQEADGIVLLNQNMHFVQGRIPWPIILTAIGEKPIEALKNSKIGRVR